MVNVVELFLLAMVMTVTALQIVLLILERIEGLSIIREAILLILVLTTVAQIPVLHTRQAHTIIVQAHTIIVQAHEVALQAHEVALQAVAIQVEVVQVMAQVTEAEVLVAEAVAVVVEDDDSESITLPLGTSYVVKWEIMSNGIGNIIL